ncbi:hypothetical protein ACET8J_04230 [Aeromonas veronii]|uniref:hypothetical protein n=1 Tax=Aeromonas veronii TaxID=654 RepID=UPI00214E3BC9|nr:hypothetical protein [Aeromonas veronii]MCR3958594.1 hypothetical protein [Aeromonas veronii]
MALSKFQESLLVISAMKNIMENDLRVFKRYINDDDLKYALNNKMLIDICSFLDEWKRFNTYAKESVRIRETMKITAPAIKRLKSWTGIAGMRNTMLAHGYRDANDNDKPTCLKKRYFEAEVPTTYAEVMLLSEFCVYVISAFICRHNEEHKAALETIPKFEVTAKKGIETQVEFDRAIKDLQEHMFELDPSLKQGFGIKI